MSKANPEQQVTVEQAMEIARGHQFNRRLADAEAVLRQVATAFPGRMDVRNELATTLGEQGKLDEAEGVLWGVVKASPGYLPAWHNLAVAAERRGKHDEAVGHLEQAVKIAPLDADTRFRIGQALKRIGRIDESMREIQYAIELNPDHVEARGVLASYLLMHGDLLRGWEEYEVRWRCPSFPDERQAWSDLRLERDDVRGKKIVIYGEQGYGDMIQFSRYGAMLAERGAEVTAVAPTDLAGVIAWERGFARVLSVKGKVNGDYVVPMMSLPRAFGTTVETIPAATPYIVPPVELVEKWRKKMQGYGGIKVGIAWAGRPEHRQDRERSMRLSRFAELGKMEGVTLFSMQKGAAAAEANPAPAGMRVVNLTAGIADFADTAGLVANLDLVIAVDTAVAHLAGAMGKEVWTLLAAVPDWRWMLGRNDSPWYPTMRLFRQTRVGEWGDVMEKVANALREKAR